MQRLSEVQTEVNLLRNAFNSLNIITRTLVHPTLKGVANNVFVHNAQNLANSVSEYIKELS